MKTCSMHIMEHYNTMVRVLEFEHDDKMRRFLIDTAYMFYKVDGAFQSQKETEINFANAANRGRNE